MAKMVLTQGMKAVYYTGIEYLETNIRPATTMVDGTIYIVDTITASRLLSRGVVSLLDDSEFETADVESAGMDIQAAPSILALSEGAHGAGAKENEADMAAYKATTPAESNEPDVDGEGLGIEGDSVVVADNKTDDL